MATMRQRKNGTWEFRVKRKGLLDKPLYFTFDKDQKEYGIERVRQLEATLDKGVVPEDLLRNGVANREFNTVGSVIEAYLKSVAVPETDQAQLSVVYGRLGKDRLSDVNYSYAEIWIRNMKHQLHRSPSTIRHQVGALARCFDWGGEKVLKRYADRLAFAVTTEAAWRVDGYIPECYDVVLAQFDASVEDSAVAMICKWAGIQAKLDLGRSEVTKAA